MALIRAGSKALQDSEISVNMDAADSIRILGRRSHSRRSEGAQPHACRRWRITTNQLTVTMSTDRAAIGQRSGPKGDKTLLNPVLRPTPAKAIGRMQHEQAASTAPTLLTMLMNVVLPPPEAVVSLGIP